MPDVLIFSGRIRSLPESGRPSGIFKTRAPFPVEIGPLGLLGDEQADRRVHGGPDKAVHYFPRPHYARLAARFPEVADAVVAGSIGENLSADLVESEVRIGDIWHIGTARLQVCQPRNPCWKIDDRYGVDGMAKFLAEQRIAGWYLRVLAPGTVHTDDRLTIETASGAPTLGEALALLAEHRPSLEQLAALLQSPALADNWRQAIGKRLAWLRRNT